MKPPEFLNTVYLGDRACKGFSIDSWENVLKIKISCISRVRSKDGKWNFYNEENIDDGFLVFSDVKYFDLSPPGYLPNDCIQECICKKLDEDELYEFLFICDSADEKGMSTQITFKIIAKGFYIETCDGKTILD